MEQTAITNSLTTELDKLVYQEAIIAAGLDISYTEMKVSNQTYIDAETDKIKSETEKEENELVSGANKKTKIAFDQLINYINAISFIEESA